MKEGIARPSLLSVQGLQRLAHPLKVISVVVSARKIRIRLRIVWANSHARGSRRA